MFEHIEGNRFQISTENVILNAEVSEPDDIKGSNLDISKEEEHRSLHIIRNKLIPKAVKSYNQHADRQQGFLDIPRITEKDVRMALKKTGRKDVKMRQEPKEIDMIRYTAKVGSRQGVVPMHFDIIKRQHWLYVEYHHQYDEYDDSRRMTVYNTERFEGKVHTIKEGEDDFYMTDEEEKRAYTFLVRNVVPKVVEDMYLRFLRRFPQMYPQNKFPVIATQDIIKRIKKQRTDIDSRTYESVINNHCYFTFLIKKKLVQLPDRKDKIPMILVGAQGPINNDWEYYELKR